MTGSLLYTKEIETKVLWMRDKDRIDLYEDGVRLSTFRVVGKNKSFTEDTCRSVKRRLVLRAPYGRHFVKAGFTAGVDTGGTASSLEYTAPAWVELSENTPIVYLKAKRRFIAPFSESGMKLVPDKK